MRLLPSVALWVSDMAKQETPEYIKLSDSKAQITLSRPLEIDGAKVSVLTMREPTVDDQLAAEKLGSGGEADKIYMANLCQVTPGDIGRLPLRDFKRLQVAFSFFID